MCPPVAIYPDIRLELSRIPFVASTVVPLPFSPPERVQRQSLFLRRFLIPSVLRRPLVQRRPLTLRRPLLQRGYLVQRSQTEVEPATDRGVTGGPLHHSTSIVSPSSEIVDLVPILDCCSNSMAHSEYDSRQQVVHDPMSEQFLVKDGEDSNVLNVLATDSRSTGGLNVHRNRSPFVVQRTVPCDHSCSTATHSPDSS